MRLASLKIPILVALALALDLGCVKNEDYNAQFAATEENLTAAPAVTYVSTYTETFSSLAAWDVKDGFKDPAGSPVKYMRSNVVTNPGGGLTIKVTKGYQNTDGLWRAYSGRMGSIFKQKYGLFMFKAKVPRGPHLWPALWTVGEWQAGETNKWPKTGEIDVMETVDSIARRADFTSRIMARTSAYPNAVYFTSLPADSSLDIKTPLTGAQWSATHTFAVDWYQVYDAGVVSDVRFDFYLDAEVVADGSLRSIASPTTPPVKLHSYSLKQLVADHNRLAPAQPVPAWQTLDAEWSAQAFVLNVAVGGAWDPDLKAIESGAWQPATDGSANMVVDWVKCFRRVAAPADTATAQAPTLAACTPAVVVVRHAEDVDSDRGESCAVGEVALAIPGGTQRVRQRCLTQAGAGHAAVYAAHLGDWMKSKNLCPAGRVITQEPYANRADGSWPSANPFETIREFALAEQAPITFWPSNKVFDTAVRTSLLTDAEHSVVIAWDKEGLSENSAGGEAPLLAKMTAATASFPDRDRVYVFTAMDPTTAKFQLKEYRQFFSDSNGYFARVVGAACKMTSFYRFTDAFVRSNTAYSPDLIPTGMTICGSTNCSGTGITLDTSMRK